MNKKKDNIIIKNTRKTITMKGENITMISLIIVSITMIEPTNELIIIKGIMRTEEITEEIMRKGKIIIAENLGIKKGTKNKKEKRRYIQIKRLKKNFMMISLNKKEIATKIMITIVKEIIATETKIDSIIARKITTEKTIGTEIMKIGSADNLIKDAKTLKIPITITATIKTRIIITEAEQSISHRLGIIKTTQAKKLIPGKNTTPRMIPNQSKEKPNNYQKSPKYSPKMLMTGWKLTAMIASEKDSKFFN